jgi:hypothetical protein
MHPMVDPNAKTGPLDLSWDTNTALAALIFGSFAFLWAVKRGFKGVDIAVS